MRNSFTVFHSCRYLCKALKEKHRSGRIRNMVFLTNTNFIFVCVHYVPALLVAGPIALLTTERQKSLRYSWVLLKASNSIA